MLWQVEYSDEFGEWYGGLSEDEQERVKYVVGVLQNAGPLLGRPLADKVRQSRHQNMKELRVQYRGNPIRILFAFDPRQVAYLILGGTQTGDEDWYGAYVPVADKIYDQHLGEIGC